VNMTSPKISSRFKVAGVPRCATAACAEAERSDAVNMG